MFSPTLIISPDTARLTRQMFFALSLPVADFRRHAVQFRRFVPAFFDEKPSPHIACRRRFYVSSSH